MKAKAPAVRWTKEWVPQDVISGGKCSLLKWVTEDMMKSLKAKFKEPEKKELDPEPMTEILFLCSYEGCGKAFIDAGALRKHAHIHGERQYVCHFDGCGKKFVDSSKLKRHFLIHTGERDFICPHAGCGKAFSLDFNLRAHLRTHSLENYHVCPYEECGKRFTHEGKLNSHIKVHHEKNTGMDTVKQTIPADKPHIAPKAAALVYGSASSDRPYVCPYEGCDKDYIHEYKLNLHLKREHPGHNSEENSKNHASDDHDIDGASDQEAVIKKINLGSKSTKRSKPSPMLPSKVPKHKCSTFAPIDISAVKKPWPIKDMYEEDSEETEEDAENAENDDDDEETEDEE